MHTLVVPLLPAFPRLIDISPTEVSWLVTSTMLAGAIGAPVFGRLGDLYGRGRTLSWFSDSCWPGLL
jgi:MFS family permease